MSLVSSVNYCFKVIKPSLLRSTAIYVKAYGSYTTLIKKPETRNQKDFNLVAFGGNMVQTNRKMSTTLYKLDGSPPARAVMMVVDLLGLKFKMEDLNPVLREQDKPEFVKMNPMRTIPILDEGDFSLGDSHAIMLYLIDMYGKPEHSYLYPADKRKRATINQRLFFECGILFPRLRAIMAPTYFGRLTELSKFMKINIEDAFQMIEEYLSQNTYIAGDHWTIADLSVYTTTQTLYALHPGDEKRFPQLNRWMKNMSELDVVKRVNEPGGEMHGRVLLQIMEMNKENQKTKLQNSKL